MMGVSLREVSFRSVRIKGCKLSLCSERIDMRKMMKRRRGRSWGCRFWRRWQVNLMYSDTSKRNQKRKTSDMKKLLTQCYINLDTSAIRLSNMKSKFSKIFLESALTSTSTQTFKILLKTLNNLNPTLKLSLKTENSRARKNQCWLKKAISKTKFSKGPSAWSFTQSNSEPLFETTPRNFKK